MFKMIDKIISMKGKEKISVLTAYDYITAKLLEEAGIDIILVGDSLGMVVLGYDTTRDVLMDDIVRHTEAVARGAKNTLIVADLPYLSDATQELAIKNSQKLVMAGAHAVKPEGKPEIVEAIVREGIPVMAHLGLLPQTAEKYKVQGKTEDEAKKILEDSIAMEKAGASALILECVPTDLAKKITESIKIPTIGIGAGPYCDGQVLVWQDMVGLFDKIQPKFVKKFTELKPIMLKAFKDYKEEVKKGKFPDKEHSF